MKMVLQIQENAMIGRAKSITSQVVACIAQNILLIDLGMAISFTTIAIPDLLNSSTGLSLNENQASWFGSLAFLCQPVGSIISGPILDYTGRKRSILLVNLPHLIAWPLMHFAWDLTSLFAANALLGLGTGLMEGPCNAYIAETCEKSLRGILTTFTTLFVSVGTFLMFLIGTVMPWRPAALVSLALPVFAAVFVLLVQETPIWLLSKNKPKEALSSLRKLRGWTTKENVQEEFAELEEYNIQIHQCVVCIKLGKVPTEDQCEHRKMGIMQRFILKMKYEIIIQENVRPFAVTLGYFIFYTMSGLFPVKPNMVNICGAMGMNDDGKTISLYVGVITIVANILAGFCIRYSGKRRLAIGSMFACFVTLAALSVYAKLNVGDEVFSYNVETFPKEKSNIPLVLFYLMVTANGFAIPWAVLPEMFPFRVRGTAIGTVAAFHYVAIFLASKTHIDAESSFGLWGSFALYAGFSFVGTFYLYFFQPETENKSLIEIEDYFKGDFRVFANDPFVNFFRRLRRSGK